MQLLFFGLPIQPRFEKFQQVGTCVNIPREEGQDNEHYVGVIFAGVVLVMPVVRHPIKLQVKLIKEVSVDLQGLPDDEPLKESSN